jgi:hypothetical protein
MFFNKIKGHTVVLSQFTDLLLSDKIEGTYLFQGPKGVGKHTVAKDLSKYILCNGTKDDTCRCSVCRLFPEVPDFLEVDPETSIKVSDLDDIEKFLSLIPYKSSKRVVLLNDLDKISYSAANGFLKIFEELKDYAIIISVSSNPDKILPALLSRATRVDFCALDPDDYIEILKTKGHKSDSLNRVKNAIPYLSQSILSDFCTYNGQMIELPGFIKGMHKMDEDDLMSLVTQKDQEQNLLHFLEAYILYLNDVMKVSNESAEALIYSDKLDDLVLAKEFLSDDLCLASIDKIRSALEQYNRGVHVGLKYRALSAFLWTFTLQQSEKAKKLNESKQRVG